MENNLLFTTATCPKCAVAKKELDAKGIDYKVVLVGDEPTRLMAIEYGITQAPTIISKLGVSFKGIEGVRTFLELN